MTTNYFKNHIPRVLGILVLSVFIYSCGNKDKGEEPIVPPIETFQMAMETDMNTSETNPDTASAPTDTTYKNWFHSGINVFVWNVVIGVTMIVPVAAYAESFNHTPEWIRKEKKWLWEYDVTVANIVYTAQLYGKTDGDYYDWEMYLSKAGGFQSFLWYEGRSKIDGTSGEWTLNQTPNSPQNFLQMDWNRNSSATVADVKYTNIIPGGAENGGYIHYGKNVNTDFNRFYYIYNKGQDNLTEIEWNADAKNGQVKDPKKFGETDLHCWDKFLLDSEC